MQIECLTSNSVSPKEKFTLRPPIPFYSNTDCIITPSVSLYFVVIVFTVRSDLRMCVAISFCVAFGLFFINSIFSVPSLCSSV